MSSLYTHDWVSGGRGNVCRMGAGDQMQIYTIIGANIVFIAKKMDSLIDLSLKLNLILCESTYDTCKLFAELDF